MTKPRKKRKVETKPRVGSRAWKAVQMLRAGWNGIEVARKLRISKQAVYALRDRWGDVL